MKNSLLLSLTLAMPLGALPLGAVAQNSPAPTLAAPRAASKTAFLTGFKEPRGLALGYKGGISVADYGAGEIVDFDADGSSRHVYSSGLNGVSDVAYGGGGGFGSMVSETLNNRVLSLNMMIFQVGDEISAPTAIVAQNTSNDPRTGRSYYVASATTGKVYRLAPVAKIAGEKNTIFNEYNWNLVTEMPAVGGKIPQIRDLSLDGDTLLISDDSGRIQMMTSTGRLVMLAQNIESPTGVAIGADKNIYVCDDSGGGRLWSIDQNGAKTLVIGDLGQPYDIVFTDDKTALVSDKRGTVWKIDLS